MNTTNDSLERLERLHNFEEALSNLELLITEGQPCIHCEEAATCSHCEEAFGKFLTRIWPWLSLLRIEIASCISQGDMVCADCWEEV